MNIPVIYGSVRCDRQPTDDAWERRVGNFLDEIEWYAEALVAQRDKKGVPY